MENDNKKSNAILEEIKFLRRQIEKLKKELKKELKRKSYGKDRRENNGISYTDSKSS